MGTFYTEWMIKMNNPRVILGKYVFEGSVYKPWTWSQWRKFAHFETKKIAPGIETWSTHSGALARHERNDFKPISGGICLVCDYTEPYGMWGHDAVDLEPCSGGCGSIVELGFGDKNQTWKDCKVIFNYKTKKWEKAPCPI